MVEGWERMKMERKGKIWERILSKRKALTNSEAAKIKKAVSVFEEEHTFE